MDSDIAVTLFQTTEGRLNALQAQVWAIQAQLVVGATVAMAFFARRVLNGRNGRNGRKRR
jgi:hypothetical protein